jgi:APA family basic amino acid/polyamine antiporter
MMHYSQLNVAAPVTAALAHVNAPWSLRFLVDFAAVAGLTSVCLVSLMSQPRLVYSMARDGLVPGFIGELHPVYRVPRVAVMGGGCLAAVMGALLPLDVLGELISFGTLVAFIVVCYTVLVKRRTRPDMPSPFLVPFAPYVPVTGMVVCFLQLLSLPPATVRNFAFVLVAAALYYALYGRFNSRALSPDLAVAIVAEEEARIARAANGADDAPKIDTGSIGK